MREDNAGDWVRWCQMIGCGHQIGSQASKSHVTMHVKGLYLSRLVNDKNTQPFPLSPASRGVCQIAKF